MSSYNSIASECLAQDDPYQRALTAWARGDLAIEHKQGDFQTFTFCDKSILTFENFVPVFMSAVFSQGV